MEETNHQVAVPDFEGQKVIGISNKLSGTSSHIMNPLELGQKGVAIIEFEVNDIAHAKTKDGLKRVQKLKIVDAYAITGKEGKVLLSNVRMQHAVAEDDRFGRLPLFPHAVTYEQIQDEDGTVLTPKEVAELQGITWPDPITLVFDDGSRFVWPDAWGKDARLDYPPAAGDEIEPPGSSDYAKVIEVLDIETGEPIDRWTDEMENERLLHEEKRLEAEEAHLVSTNEVGGLSLVDVEDDEL